MKLSPDLERSRIAVSYAYDLLQVMEARGASSAAIIADSGVPAVLLRGHDSRLTLGQFVALVQACARHGDASGLGYAFGLNVKAPSHGLLGLAVQNARTAREALQIAARYIPLRSSHVRLHLNEEAAVAALQVDGAALFPELRRFFHECLAGVLVRSLRELTGSCADAEIWFEHEEPPYHRDWRAHLPPVRFRMPGNQIRLPRALLDVPLPAPNPLSTRAAIYQMETQLDRGVPPATVAQVRSLLESAGEVLPGLAEVAAGLALSASTLKRRLQQEGVSFQRVLDEVRRDRALALLREPAMTIEQVARQLGYSDAANFTRAFRKWTGRSPTDWRQGR